MKDNTKQNLAALTAAVMAAYFLFNGIMMLGEGAIITITDRFIFR